VHTFTAACGIASLALAPEDRQLLVGLQDGKLLIVAKDSLEQQKQVVAKDTDKKSGSINTAPQQAPDSGSGGFLGRFKGAFGRRVATM
jgi:hypothetical protein